MSSLRFSVLAEAQARALPQETPPPADGAYPSDRFAERVFGPEAMKRYLAHDARKALRNYARDRRPLDHQLADAVAQAMKSWALDHGAVHYTHWFQPLTNLTAEKHDTFLDFEDDRPMEQFSGRELAQQEPDASSLPSGGLRNTFEARGYTAWDPASPAFILGDTLCIPSIFISYTGEALDNKGPLLKSLAVLDEAATAVCQLWDPNVEGVVATLGVEQEYFLVDAAYVRARPDLLLTGRTLVGAPPAKGQQLEDHYFGTMPGRAMAFMQAVEHEARLLGIPIKTRHNEVAPSQFEMALRFGEMNVSIDQNLLLMNVMRRVAGRFGLAVLFHPKPYAGVNGSGKHCNWALATTDGQNLMSPGKTADQQLRFLCFVACVLRAVHQHGALLRNAVASIGNDLRLGANEAPPAIVSAFLGEELTRVLNDLEAKEDQPVAIKADKLMDLDIEGLPEVFRHNTDRNRTSPFAFTGNKFEYRAVASSANPAQPMTVLNAAMAQALNAFHNQVMQAEQTGLDRNAAVRRVLRSFIQESKPVRFEGNNYSDEWVAEAERRGLANLRTTADALGAMENESAYALYEEMGIFNRRELDARRETLAETYLKKALIELKVQVELTETLILPAAFSALKHLGEAIEALDDAGLDDDALLATPRHHARTVAQHTANLRQKTDALKQVISDLEADLEAHDAPQRMARALREQGHAWRQEADALEALLPDDLWPLLKYRELLFGL